MNLLDVLIWLMLAGCIGSLIALWIRRKRSGARLSWKSIAFLTAWALSFLAYEIVVEFDGDPETLTLSVMMVGSVSLRQIETVTLLVLVGLMAHWWDVDRRLVREG